MVTLLLKCEKSRYRGGGGGGGKGEREEEVITHVPFL